MAIKYFTDWIVTPCHVALLLNIFYSSVFIKSSKNITFQIVTGVKNTGLGQ